MISRVLGLAIAVSLAPRLAAADQCEKVILDALADCRLAADDKAALAKMSTDEQANAAALKAEISALERKPLYPYCRGINVNAKTCDTLASAISVNVTVDLGERKPLADDAFKAAVKEKTPADRQTSTNKGGSSAQTDPVESIQPITLDKAAARRV